MKAESRPPFRFDTSLLYILACPACLGGLFVEGERLVCALCGRGYPIVDGIPVLIAGSEQRQGQG
jgi:uncharacterized protein YbaR (Trm112 family)